MPCCATPAQSKLKIEGALKRLLQLLGKVVGDRVSCKAWLETPRAVSKLSFGAMFFGFRVKVVQHAWGGRRGRGGGADVEAEEHPDDDWHVRQGNASRHQRTFARPFLAQRLFMHSIVTYPYSRTLLYMFQAEHLAATTAGLQDAQRRQVLQHAIHAPPAAGRSHIDNVNIVAGQPLLYPFVRDGGIVDSAMEDFAAFLDGRESPLLRPLIMVGQLTSRPRHELCAQILKETIGT